MATSTPKAPQAADPGAATYPVAADIEAQVRAAQSALVFKRARTSNLLAPLVGLLVCWVLWEVISHAVLFVWFAALMLTTTWRELVHRGFANDSPANAARWGPRYEVALFGNGLVYGLIGTVLLPSQEPAIAAIMLSTIVGIVAVGVLVLSTSLRASLALTLPVLLPTIALQLAQGSSLSTYVGLSMTIFLVLIAVEGRQAAGHTLAMLRVRFRMDDLAAQRQQALDLAQRSSAVKSQFLATMSHEMRTPLHGILGVARLLRSAQPQVDAQVQSHQLEMIERTGEHLLGLINDVLDYSKIEGGHLRVERSDFDLAALVQAVGDLTRVSAAEKCLALNLALHAAAPCWVRGDAPRLRQVLLNLTGNAVKFTDHGSITLSVRREPGGGTVFEVLDTGPGIVADQRGLIFEAFQQADGSYGRRHGGTGLGLTISRELARAMGGDLLCAPHPAGGARFVLKLPLPDAAPAARTAQPVPATPVLSGRVLVAEDNAVNAVVAEAFLKRTGLRVDVVADGTMAVEHAAATRYDLILMDCQMPGMDGFEATARIRTLEKNAGARAVPIVALTANALESDRQRSIAAGMNDHLAKPFREQDLNAVLQRFLG